MRAYNRSNTEQTVQLTETAVLSPVLLNETRFQYIRNRSRQQGNNSIPTIVVQEAFISGGSQIGLAHNDEDRWELQNYSTWTTGHHILRFGLRLRGVHITDFSPQNFGGTFTFSGGNAPQLDADNQIVRDANGDAVLIPITSIERFRRTLLFQGRSDMRANGGGATQFSLAGGNPEASVRQIDLGGFFQDEWRIRPNLTFTAGLRYERQTNISSNLNFAAARLCCLGSRGKQRRQWSGRACKLVTTQDGNSRRHGSLLRSLRRARHTAGKSIQWP